MSEMPDQHTYLSSEEGNGGTHVGDYFCGSCSLMTGAAVAEILLSWSCW